VRFNDTELQRCYESNLAGAGPAPGELTQISALLAVRTTFAALEGIRSARVHEAVEVLLSSELRPGLRRWYRLTHDSLDEFELELRNHLSNLAGERLEQPTISP